MNPVLVLGPDDRLARRPDDEGLLELLAAADRDYRQLGREALDVLGLLLEEAHRDEHGEVRVLVPRLLKSPVHLGLDALPDRVASRPHHHAALDRAVVRELRVEDDVDVPLGVVDSAGGDLLCHTGDLLVERK